MSFSAKNPLIAPKIDSIPPNPPDGTRGIFATPEGWMDIDDDGTVRELGSDTVDQTYNPESENAQSGKAVAEAIINKADKSHIHTPSDIATSFLEDGSMDGTLADTLKNYSDSFIDLYPRVYSLEDNKADKEHTHDTYDIVYNEEPLAYTLSDLCFGMPRKADKTEIGYSKDTSYTFDFSNNYNREIRLTAPSAISIKFVDDEYADDYISGLSFNSGDTPIGFDYTASGIINWVGTDCTKDGDLSIFQPSANTHYDIVFYFNGSQFIGLVNGFVPATGNVVSV